MDNSDSDNFKNWITKKSFEEREKQRQQLRRKQILVSFACGQTIGTASHFLSTGRANPAGK